MEEARDTHILQEHAIGRLIQGVHALVSQFRKLPAEAPNASPGHGGHAEDSARHGLALALNALAAPLATAAEAVVPELG